jgi:hypothetical protein
MMRQKQLEATMDNLDEEDELTGQGKGYFIKDMVYGNNQVVDKNLYGMESVILSYILERGFLGLALWALFYVLLFIYFKMHRQRYKRLTGLGVSFLLLYVFFSVGTGELGSVYPTMLLFGFVIKAIEYDKTKMNRLSIMNEKTCDCYTSL